MPSAEQLRGRLMKKLLELFQLDQPDLDFGFYRIMHAKAKEIQDFIGNDLLREVTDAFGPADESRKAELLSAYDQAVQTAKEFGIPHPEGSEPVKKARAALNAAKDTASAEAEVYDHLYRFFERYYDDGDFLSRRYFTRETPGKASPFAVPYNGEEVKVHWANADQYYIKTAENFSNFSFDIAQADEIRSMSAEERVLQGLPDQARKVHFRVLEGTEGEHGNLKVSDANKRFFLLHADNPVAITEAGELTVNFEYRPAPERTGQENAWREKTNASAVETIVKRLQALAAEGEDGEHAAEYLGLCTVPAPTDGDKKRPLLAKYLAKYTARNTTDYFIHKDLGAFLRRELDFYIKNEVMRLDDIENAEAPAVENYLSHIKLLRRIGGKLIDFLAQLEDFQKKLWLKKKFVVEANYCVTLDRVPRELYPEVAANADQCEEWVSLFAIDDIAATPGFSRPLTVPFLEANDKLLLDTRFFDDGFKARLLASVENFDEQCDGLLIHSENFQALNLLRERYRGQVKCVYIDPPYNTSEETFLYKNSYRHSSWMSMMADRVAVSRGLQTEDGALVAAIDDEELYHLKETLSLVCGEDNYIGTIVVQSNPRGRGINSHYATAHDYCLVYASDRDLVHIVDQPLTEEQSQDFGHGDGESSYRLLPFRRSGGYSTPEERPNSEFPLFYSKKRKAIVAVGGTREKDYPADYECRYILELDPQGEVQPRDFPEFAGNPDIVSIFPVDTAGNRRVWRWSDRKKILTAAVRGDFVVKSKGDSWTVQLKDWIKEGRKAKTVWFDSKYDASSHGTNLLIDLFGARKLFGYPKSLHSTYDAVHTILGDDPQSCCLDFFGGSGTTGQAVIDINRMDDGNRKYVLVEMGNYFHTVLKPRIAKIVYSKGWKDGKPTARDTGISHCLCYLRLESYEDTLNNLRFDDNPRRKDAVSANPALKEDYLLHYLLDVETRGSQSLLNIDAFTDPTAYTLEVKKAGSDQYVTRTVDLVTTFNYLIGLRVLHTSVPETFQADFRRVADPELPKDQRGKLVVDGALRPTVDGPWWFRAVEGWMPKDAAHPGQGLGEKVLIVWRKLTGDIEQDNLLLDKWFAEMRTADRAFDFATVYVNGSNNLANLKEDGETWRVRLIEEEFMKRMWNGGKA